MQNLRWVQIKPQHSRSRGGVVIQPKGGDQKPRNQPETPLLQNPIGKREEKTDAILQKSSNLNKISKILAGTAATGFSGKVLNVCLCKKVKSDSSGRVHGKVGKVMGYPQMIKGTRENAGDGFIGNGAPQRVTITLNYAAYKGLERRSAVEGRSMSNLAAFILENAPIENS